MATIDDVTLAVEQLALTRASELEANPAIYRSETDTVDVLQAHWLELAVRQKLERAGRYRVEFCDDRDASDHVRDESELIGLRAMYIDAATNSKTRKTPAGNERWRQVSSPLPASSMCQSIESEAIRYAERKVTSHLDPMLESLLTAFRNTDTLVETMAERVVILSTSIQQARRQAEDRRLYGTIRPDVLTGTVFNTILAPPTSDASDLWLDRIDITKKKQPPNVSSGTALGWPPRPDRQWREDTTFPESYIPGAAPPLLDSNLSEHTRMLRLDNANTGPKVMAQLELLYASYMGQEVVPAVASDFVTSYHTIDWPRLVHAQYADIVERFNTDYKLPKGGWPTPPPTGGTEAYDDSVFGWNKGYDARPGRTPDNGSTRWISSEPTLIYYPFTFWKRAAILGSRAALWRYAYLMYMLIMTGTDDPFLPGEQANRRGSKPARPNHLLLPMILRATTTNFQDAQQAKNELVPAAPNNTFTIRATIEQRSPAGVVVGPPHNLTMAIQLTPGARLLDEMQRQLLAVVPAQFRPLFSVSIQQLGTRLRPNNQIVIGMTNHQDERGDWLIPVNLTIANSPPAALIANRHYNADIDRSLLKNELDTIVRLSTGQPVFMDTHDMNEEALFCAIGHPSKVPPEKFNSLFFDDETAHFELDLTAWRQDSLYTAGVAPKLRRLGPRSRLHRHNYYYAMGTARSWFFGDSFWVSVLNRVTTLAATSLIGATLANVPQSIFSFAALRKDSGDKPGLIDIAAMYLSHRWIRMGLLFAYNASEAMVKQRGESNWRNLSAWALVYFATSVVGLNGGWLRFAFGPSGISYGDVWVNLRKDSGVTAEDYLRLHPKAYYREHEREAILRRIEKEVSDETKAQTTPNRQPVEPKTSPNVTYSFVDRGAPLRPISVDSSLATVVEQTGADQLVWSEVNKVPRDKIYYAPVARAGYLNAIAALRVIESEVRSDRFMATLGANNQTFLNTPTQWAAAAEYLGQPDLATSNEARDAFVRQLLDDRLYILNRLDPVAEKTTLTDDDVAQFDKRARRLFYIAGDEYLEEMQDLASNVRVSKANRLGANRLSRILGTNASLRSNVAHLLVGKNTTEFVTLLANEEQPDPPQGWFLRVLPAEMLRPEDCLFLGGILTSGERLNEATSPLTQFRAIGNETTMLGPQDLERLCLLPMVITNYIQPYRTAFPKPPPPPPSSSSTETVQAVEETRPPDRSEINRRYAAEIVNSTVGRDRMERAVRTGHRAASWAEAFKARNYVDYWDPTARSSGLTHINALKDTLLYANTIDPEFDEAVMRSQTRPGNATKLDPASADDRAFYLNRRLVTNLIASFSYEGGAGFRAIATVQEYFYTVPIVDVFDDLHEKHGYLGTLVSAPMRALSERLKNQGRVQFNEFVLLDNYLGLAGTIMQYGPWFAPALSTFLSNTMTTLNAPLWLTGILVTALAESGFGLLRMWGPADLLPTLGDIWKNELVILLATARGASVADYKRRRVRMYYAYRARIGLGKLLSLVYHLPMVNNILAFAGWSWLFNTIAEYLPFVPQLVSPIAMVWPPTIEQITHMAQIGDTWLIPTAIATALIYWLIVFRIVKVSKKNLPGSGKLASWLGTFVSAYIPSPFIAFVPLVAELIDSIVMPMMDGMVGAGTKISRTAFENLVSREDILNLFPVEQRRDFAALVAVGYHRDTDGYPKLNEKPPSPSSPPTSTDAIVRLGGDMITATITSGSSLESIHLESTRHLDDWRSWATLGVSPRSVRIVEEDVAKEADDRSELPQPMQLLDMTMTAYRNGDGNGEFGMDRPPMAATAETSIGLSL